MIPSSASTNPAERNGANSEDICAIFVTYNPGTDLLENIRSVQRQVSQVIVVDNGSSSTTETQLKQLETWPRCVIIRNRGNLGIAAALNRGVSKALQMKFKWIVTFDQDSRIGDGFMHQMLRAFQDRSVRKQVAIVSPVYIDHSSGTVVRLRRSKTGEIVTTMTSGSMVPSYVFQMIGLFDESLFIDAVDTEFCLRIRRAGMQILQSDAELQHSLGKTTYHRIIGARFGATNHSVGRRYYITRNRWLLLFRYRADRVWVWNELRALLHETIKILLVERQKLRKFHAMGIATAHALQGKVGKQVDL